MLAEIENLLKRTMGLDAASIGLPAISRSVQTRMQARRLKQMDDYWAQLRDDPDELQALIETVVVPETWFFRDREAFTALGGVAYAEWLRTNPDGVFKVLSLPCSTGEEPYSMAMTLLDAGAPPNRFRIDAVDISARVVAYAQQASYGRNSFRGDDLAFRERYFTAEERSWKLAPVVTRQVHFQAANLFDPDFIPGAALYDVIFCRNVLIYFDRPTQDRAVAVLQRLLTPRGFLFVGPSETGLLLSHNFDPAKIPLAFAFRQAGVLPRPERVAPVVHRPPVRFVPRPPSVRPPARVIVPVPPVEPVPVNVKPSTSPGDLDQVEQLANQGHLAEASRLCEALLHSAGPSARAYCLLGLIRDAAGNHAEAIQQYRKALYLEPKHREALLHLASLLEKQGDPSGARVLNDRARRLTA
jgi:chemotaxis protein methyltransferase WspC